MRHALLSLLLAAAAWANPAYFADAAVDAAEVPTVPLTTTDAAWGKAKAKAFRVSAQRTVRLTDKKANAHLEQPGAGAVEVRALVSRDALGLLVEWKDATRDVVRPDETNAFADAAALEVPMTYGAGQRLPYVGMGDHDQKVLVFLQRATKDGVVANQYVAAGFGSLTRVPAAQGVTQALRYDEARKTWQALFVRPLELDGHSVARGVVPVAFAVWDGGRQERGGYKQLTSWHVVRLPGRPVDAAHVKELAWGYGPGELGDAARGRQLAETVCVACHHLPGKTFATPGVAPALHDVGAIATLPYLRDSLVNPSAVVVHALQPNAHYNPTGTRDPNGAFPHQEMYIWSTTGADGRPVSKMPPFAHFSPEQLGDLVAFLKTLDGTVKEAP